jgi:hypothetical protein
LGFVPEPRASGLTATCFTDPRIHGSTGKGTVRQYRYEDCNEVTPYEYLTISTD